MFDEFDDTDVQLEEDQSTSEDEEEPKEMGLGKVLLKLILCIRSHDSDFCNR